MQLWRLRARNSHGKDKERDHDNPIPAQETPNSPPNGQRVQVTEQIVRLKRESPWFGAKRISQFPRRMFQLSAGAETVRQRLPRKELVPHQAGPAQERHADV